MNHGTGMWVRGIAVVILDGGRVGGGHRRGIRILTMVSTFQAFCVCFGSALRGLVGLSKCAGTSYCLFFFFGLLGECTDSEMSTDEEPAPGHPYIESEHVQVAAPANAAEPPHDATTEQREVAEEVEDARGVESRATDRSARVENVEEIASEETGHHVVPAPNSGAPVAMPEPGDYIPPPPGHPAPNPAQRQHLNLDTDDEAEESESDASGASTEATTAPPRRAPTQKRPTVRGGAGDASDADEYDLHEEYDDKFEEDGWTPRDGLKPKQNWSSDDEPTFHAHSFRHAHSSHHAQSSHHDRSPRGPAPGPLRPQPVDHSDSPFYRYGANYVPLRRPQPGGPPPGGYGMPPPRPSPGYTARSGGRTHGTRYKPRTRNSDSESNSDAEGGSSRSKRGHGHRSSGRSSGRHPRQPKATPPRPADYYAILGVGPDSTEKE